MKINIKTKNLELTPAMRDFINTKIGALERQLIRFEKEGALMVEVEIARPSHHHHKGKVYYAEANLRIGKNMLRAESDDYNIRVAVNKVRQILDREIRKYKTEIGAR
ncbi:MAG: ribosomal subunit interface protein [Candidatus Harrisonbacteria bacterium CG10_big_fil_rev_8_21_14_0_10_49_15]|uniref:Ribosomal subunit interface protein n=1 Tax=Candidatus Harrisonbacteria bacterium CG10_big_fil_rev_8_21_14_0_10_49_15 TaxID=1974587 RepID=A0A2H0UKM6_9BACT|nr:MAG: ribosomal subunit interface protein [Candidatus Harrisonbacteria bacterium CG10_big_fil_rev_8_21_14_0_10_49_15]